MRKHLITAVAVLCFAPMALAAGPPPRPNPGKDMQKLASECVLQAVGSGAYTSMGYAELSEFCVELAKAIYTAEYVPAGECPFQ